MRPYRIGTRAWTRLSACFSSSEIGSGRSAAGTNCLWLDLGDCWRADLPRATRSSTVRRARLQAEANDSGAGSALDCSDPVVPFRFNVLSRFM
jgi:hypothetical protein